MGKELPISVSVSEIQRFFDSLALSLLIGDDVAALVAATRLRSALARARTVASAVADTVMLNDIADAARPLLARVPKHVEGLDTLRFARWISKAGPMPALDGLGPDQFELEGAARELPSTIWKDLHVIGANLQEADLYRAEFDGVYLAGCQLLRVNAARSSWIGARVIETNLAGAMLTDATIRGATFEDCDLRGAHLGTDLENERAVVSRTRFLRCDLRDTTWSRRVVAGVQLIECKVFGIRGAAQLDGIEVVRADSSNVDGRVTYVPPGDVLAAWCS